MLFRLESDRHREYLKKEGSIFSDLITLFNSHTG